jgi:hypothetical protein
MVPSIPDPHSRDVKIFGGVKWVVRVPLMGKEVVNTEFYERVWERTYLEHKTTWIVTDVKNILKC